MIIDFTNVNGGGGGSGYTLPVATSEVLGGVKIGQGVNVTSDGTISVQGGDSTKLVSVSELPLTADTGDVFVMGDYHTYPRCQIEDNNMNTLSLGGHPIDNEEKLYVWSEMADDKLVLQYGDYYGYKLYIYGGQDQHFRFETYLGDDMVDNGDIYQGETGTTEFTNEGVTFNLNFEGECLEITISTPQCFLFTVFYNQEHKEMFLNDGTFMAKDSGERAALDFWYNGSYENNNKHIVFLYYGELPQNEILFKVHHKQWNNDTYWSWDGEKLCSWNDENMSDRNEEFDMYFNTNGLSSFFYMYNFTEGVLSIASRELDDVWELYGDWYKYDEMTYEPIDWQNKVNNIKSFALPLAYGKINGVAFLGAGDIYLNGVPDGGSVGQVLKKTNDGFAWSDLPKDLQVVGDLPPFADEGSVAIVNGGISHTTSAFISRNSTSESDRNNFSDNDDIDTYYWGDNYIYFGNASAYTNTKDTFLYRIALRTNENDDWDTSNIAYINLVKADDTYEIFMDNFNYYDTGGTPTAYTFTMVLSSTGTTSGNTPYLPLWRWWDGGEGYKFHFELDQDNNLKMWMRFFGVDRDNQEPDYVEGENYGYIAYRCMNHTTDFYSQINFDQDDTHLHIYKGGAWYELGYLTRQGV